MTFLFVLGQTTVTYTLSLHDALPISRMHEMDRVTALRDRLEAAIRAIPDARIHGGAAPRLDRKSTRLNSSHVEISYAVFCLKKKSLLVLGQEHLAQRRDTRLREKGEL